MSAKVLIHEIEKFSNPDQLVIHFNNVRNKFFGKGHVVLGSATGRLTLTLNYNESGDLILEKDPIHIIADENFNTYHIDLFAVTQVIVAAISFNIPDHKIETDIHKFKDKCIASVSKGIDWVPPESR